LAFLSTTCAAIADLEVIKLSLESLDCAMGELEILVETITLGNKLEEPM
jgi:hypothetical protein